jgi:basic membrane protein A and related proteins
VKKLHLVWACLLITALLLPACGETKTDPDCTLEDVFCVGLVTDGGKVDDQAMNQAVWSAMQAAQTKLGVTVNYIETVDPKDDYKNITAFCDVGYDLIFVVGSSLADATILAAQEYPDQFFIGVDQPKAETAPGNFAPLTFPPDQAGYMAGALAALMTKTNKIGGVFASDDLPYAWQLGEGYKAGATYINPEIQATIVYHSDVEPAESFSDPEWGTAQAVTLIKGGADILFASGDATGNAALVSAVESNALVIGYGTDQFITLPAAQSGLLSSLVKNINPVVFDVIKVVKDRKSLENIEGVEDLKQLGYGAEFLSWFTSQGIGALEYAPFHNLSDKVSDEVKTKLKEIQAGLSAGTLTTGVPPAKPGPVPAPTEAGSTPEPTQRP